MPPSPALVLVVGLLLVAVLVPAGLGATRRLRLSAAIVATSLIGPIVAFAATLVGLQTMAIPPDQARNAILATSLASLGAAVVAYRLAKPLANDLGEISNLVRNLRGGGQSDLSSMRAGSRSDEVGDLARTITELDAGLRAEARRREAAEAERAQVVEALGHDLRTPLSSMLSSIEAIDDGLGNATDHLRSLRCNLAAIDHLVADLFLLARAEHRLEVASERVDLAELVDEALEAASGQAVVNGVDLRADLDVETGSIPVIWGDPLALGRVLRNLLDNAINHATGRCEVIVANTPDGSVELTVSDDGPGFPADFLPIAFDRFTRADPSRNARGSGLGLAICRAFVEAHGGTIELFAGPGGRVRVALPAAIPEPSAQLG